MDKKFATVVEGLDDKLRALLSQQPVSHGGLPLNMPSKGVYLFSQGSAHLYVGRSNSLRARYGRHCRNGATHRQASFAFKLAREATGNLVASYRNDTASRDGLMRDPSFQMAFIRAKARIREMDYRYVEEGDQTKQALLELYVSIVLDTPYNDFNTY